MGGVVGEKTVNLLDKPLIFFSKRLRTLDVPQLRAEGVGVNTLKRKGVYKVPWGKSISFPQKEGAKI